MKKVIFDTNVLIDWINDKQFKKLIFESALQSISIPSS